MKKFFTNKYVLTFLGLLLFFVIWFLVYLIGGKDQSVFPDPISTFEQMFVYLGDSYTYLCIWGSLSRMLIGFGIGAALGFLVGMLVGNHLKLKHVFSPTMVAIKAIPTAAVVFIFLKLAGLSNASIYVVVLIVFPIVYEATVGGYSSIPEQMVMASRVDGANYVMRNIKVKLPLAFPYITVGLLSSFALSFKIEIMAEVISGSSAYGIGRAIHDAYVYVYELVPTFAYSLIAIVIMLLFTAIIDIIKKIFQSKTNLQLSK